MRILVAAVLFSLEQSGVQRHGFGLVQSLLTRREISSVTIAIGPWQEKLFEAASFMTDSRVTLYVVDAKPDALRRNRWYVSKLALLARRLEIDLVHMICPAPLNARDFACPVVVSLHDMYPYQIPSNFGMLKGFFNRRLLQHCLANASAIACVSDATYLEMGRYVPNAVRQRALRIYNCVETSSSRCEEKLELQANAGVDVLRNKAFLLCVAQHRANKNIPFLLRCFIALLRAGAVHPMTQLAIVGIAGPETSRILVAIENAELQNNVALLHGLSDAEITWCYKNCLCVVAPSLVEGFGLPVAEALQLGCRVVCSEIAAFREVGLTHCSYVPFGDGAEAAFASKVAEVLDQPVPEPIAMPWLSRAVIAEEYLSLYRRLLGEGSSAHRLALPTWLYRDSLGELAERTSV